MTPRRLVSLVVVLVTAFDTKGMSPLKDDLRGVTFDTLIRGDVGHLYGSGKYSSSASSNDMLKVKSRQTRFIAFPSGSTLSLENKLTIPVSSINSGRQVLSKIIKYIFNIKLPNERLIFTGVKNMFNGYGVMDMSYGKPRPDDIIQSSVPPSTSYGAPNQPQSTQFKVFYGDAGQPSSGGSSYSSGKKELDSGSVQNTSTTPLQQYMFVPTHVETFSNHSDHFKMYNIQDLEDDIKEPINEKYHFGVYLAPVDDNHIEGGGGENSNSNSTKQSQPDESLGKDQASRPAPNLNDPSVLESAFANDENVIMSPMDHQRLLGFLSIEKTFDSAGLPGRWCVLKAICEVAAEPLEEAGLVGEMINLFLAAGYGDGSPGLLEYMIAEEIGYSDGDCDRHFNTCPVEIMGMLRAGVGAYHQGFASAAFGF